MADLHGYTGQPTGSPAGMLYQPADHTGTSRGVAIDVRADRISVETLCLDAECVTEGDLTYVRRADEHGYLRRGAAPTSTSWSPAAYRSTAPCCARRSRPSAPPPTRN
ncbi:hypothetical protein [Phytohabitans kaempferiae]|uniref:Uncharacterized protein n=1 Tax=Phytohabitans kaempferiae TaxID=1620943 RepID=A0ABV6LW98_9ACTN